MNHKTPIRGWEIRQDGPYLVLRSNDDLPRKIREQSGEIQRQISAHEELLVLAQLPSQALEQLISSCMAELKRRAP